MSNTASTSAATVAARVGEAIPLGTAEDPAAAAAYRKAAWRLAPLFSLCFLTAYVDRANVGFAKLQMLSDLKWSEHVYGLGAGLFFVSYVLLEVPSNLILQKVGAKAWIARIMVSWGLLSGLMMFVNSTPTFYVLRFLLGAAEAGFMPGAMLYFTGWFPARRRSRIIAVFMMGIPLAGILGGPLSGWIMTAFQGLGGAAGWRWLFALEAIPAIALGIFVYLWLPRTVADAAWLTPEEQALIKADLAREPVERHGVADLAGAFKDAKVWLLGAVDGGMLLGLYAITFWLPTLIHNAGVAKPLHVGLITAIPHAVAIVAMALIGLNSDRLRERRRHAAIPMLVGAAALALSAAAMHNLVAVVVLMAIANAGIMGAMGPFWSIPGNFLRGEGAAAGMALTCSIANLAGFFSTYLIGWLMDLTHTAAAALVLFAACMAAGAVVVLRLPSALVDG